MRSKWGTIRASGRCGKFEDLAKRAVRAAGDDDAGPATRSGRDQDPGNRGGERFAGEVSGINSFGAEKCAYRRQRARRARRIPAQARSGAASVERYYPAD